jgi:hypothetical protein
MVLRLVAVVGLQVVDLGLAASEADSGVTSFRFRLIGIPLGRGYSMELTRKHDPVINNTK